jgi:hypothetical protein
MHAKSTSPACDLLSRVLLKNTFFPFCRIAIPTKKLKKLTGQDHAERTSVAKQSSIRLERPQQVSSVHSILL